MKTATMLDSEWRELVFPAGWRNPVPAPRYNLVVIGAGPAGLITAIAAAGLGARVALIEKHAMGGDCLNVGCVPSKALLSAAARGADFTTAMRRIREVRTAIAHHDSVARYTQAGVDVFLGAASFESPHRIRVGDAVLDTRKTVICTGARATLPPIPGLADVGARTNETIFDLDAAPRRLAILGAGPIGCELAQAFARLGVEVHLLEGQPRVLPIEDADAAALVAAALERDGVRLHLGVKVERAELVQGLRRIVLAGGESIEAEELLVAAGRRRNIDGLGLERAGVRADPRDGVIVDARLRTSHRDVFAAGDVCSRYQFTHSADAQARIVIRNALFFGRARVDALVMPWCTYTSPEVAHLGATRRELEAAGRPFDALRVQFGDLDRGRTDASGAADALPDGYAEALVERGSDRLLGATIVGKDAGEQLAPLALMMTAGIGFGALGSLVLPYPTRSEYLRRLADAWNRQRLTPRTAWLLAALLRWRR
jgi:pyruvate/2-oxoglutarate dehydrogenase complex dihydrolipoamide dehydrogenase (E3) component